MRNILILTALHDLLLNEFNHEHKNDEEVLQIVEGTLQQKFKFSEESTDQEIDDIREQFKQEILILHDEFLQRAKAAM